MSGVRVLLVEDEGLIRLVTAMFLQDGGFIVTEAVTADDAAELLATQAHEFDVLFTDVQMPGTLDGVDLAIEARQRRADMPVLVTSGHAPHLLKRLGALDPAARVLSKPYDLNELATSLARLASGF